MQYIREQKAHRWWIYSLSLVWSSPRKYGWPWPWVKSTVNPQYFLRRKHLFMCSVIYSDWIGRSGILYVCIYTMAVSEFLYFHMRNNHLRHVIAGIVNGEENRFLQNTSDRLTWIGKSVCWSGYPLNKIVLPCSSVQLFVPSNSKTETSF